MQGNMQNPAKMAEKHLTVKLHMKVPSFQLAFCDIFLEKFVAEEVSACYNRVY